MFYLLTTIKILPSLVENILLSFTVKLYGQEKFSILQMMKISRFF